MIGTNGGDRVDTVNTMLADLPSFSASRTVKSPLAGAVTFENWKVLDDLEQEAGRAQDRPRRKVPNI
ncbi:hypothetical protein J3456_16180 [Sulfitobacter sp. NFXS29]|uniref:hypothetical protein n=1 Tax=Sulfitobacter sp. NFXS29 TaxID=2818438 RepID=UPI0032DE5360